MAGQEDPVELYLNLIIFLLENNILLKLGLVGATKEQQSFLNFWNIFLLQATH